MGKKMYNAAEKERKAAEEKKKRRKNRILMIGIPAVMLIAVVSAIWVVVASYHIKPCSYADIEIAGYGTVSIALADSMAPNTVANFQYLASMGFYDGLTFHRILDGFMMQGGDPNGDGTGGSNGMIEGEMYNNGFTQNVLSHKRGTISMARRNGLYDSATSQFFIVQKDQTSLDGEYAAFGWVTKGMNIVDRICREAEPIDDNGLIAKEDQPVIVRITLRDEPTFFEKLFGNRRAY